MEILSKIFEYPFVLRAVITGVLLCCCAALLGVNLVLKRYSMLGDGLSHVSFGAAAIALAFGFAPLQFSIPIVIIAAFLLLRINGNGKIKGDAAISIVSTSALAIGITVANLTTGMNTDISNYMFGSILALGTEDVVYSVIISVLVIALYIMFYNKIFAVSFDEKFAASSGINVKFYNGLSAVLTAVTVVVGMRIMGALLISSIITFPVLSAMRVTKKYRSTVILSVIISVVAFLIGIILSFSFDIPAGAAVVLTNLAIFIILNCFS
ncbi:MAG: metal ABC transporter permease [Clostridia bacterium]|nr:metal ABC transporter permease [Clostridia bacterium]